MPACSVMRQSPSQLPLHLPLHLPLQSTSFSDMTPLSPTQVPEQCPLHTASHSPAHWTSTLAVPWQTALKLHVPPHCTLSCAGSQRVTTSISPGLHAAST